MAIRHTLLFRGEIWNLVLQGTIEVQRRLEQATCKGGGRRLRRYIRLLDISWVGQAREGQGVAICQPIRRNAACAACMHVAEVQTRLPARAGEISAKRRQAEKLAIRHII